jgi:hypothetical protein
MKTYFILIALLLISMTLIAENPWQQVSTAGVTLRYRISTDGASLENQVSAATTGWVSVGYRPTTIMRDADFIIGYVSGTTASVRDDWGTGSQTHASDVSLGGVSNLTAVSGTQVGSTTTIYFTIPMNSGDQYDRIMTTGVTYPIILASGDNDSYTSQHSNAGYANINIAAPVANSDSVLPVNNEIKLSSYPNPFNPQTTLKWDMASDAEVGLQIFNAKGQLVFTMPTASFKAGSHTYTWNGSDNQGRNLPNGNYYTRLISPKQTQTLKITMLK